MCSRGDIEVIEIGGRTRDIDRCIASLVMVLNTGGVRTVASCCGHGLRPGNIALQDGRELIIAQNYEQGREIEAALTNAGFSRLAEDD